MREKFCLVSVSDKSSLELVLPVIKKHAFTLLSTGGTYEFIKKKDMKSSLLTNIHLTLKYLKVELKHYIQKFMVAFYTSVKMKLIKKPF